MFISKKSWIKAQKPTHVPKANCRYTTAPCFIHQGSSYLVKTSLKGDIADWDDYITDDMVILDIQDDLIRYARITPADAKQDAEIIEDMTKGLSPNADVAIVVWMEKHAEDLEVVWVSESAKGPVLITIEIKGICFDIEDFGDIYYEISGGSRVVIKQVFSQKFKELIFKKCKRRIATIKDELAEILAGL